MSEANWGNDHLEPPKKRRIPLWLLGCGGGCMLLVGAIIVAGFLLGPRVEKWMEEQSEPTVQWPRIAEVLPFDAPPADFTIQRWPVPMFDMWMLESTAQDLFVYVFVPPGDGNAQWGQWLLDPKQAPMFSEQEGNFETVETTLVVQGRELSCVRFTRIDLPPPSEPPAEPVESDPELERIERTFGGKGILGSGLDLDVTPEGSSRRVLMWMVRGARGATISDEEAKAFLAPFKIGPQR